MERNEIKEMIEKFIKKTKETVKDEERFKKIIEEFEKEFNFPPFGVSWKDRRVFAQAWIMRADLADLGIIFPVNTIQGERIKEIYFEVYEKIEKDGKEHDWKLIVTSEAYYWTKETNDYEFVVEIRTEKETEKTEE